MKTLGLLFSLLLLAIGGGLLIFFSFASLSFNWQDLLFYLVIALIVYGIVRAVGGSLDKKFNNSVKQFLDGKKRELFDDKGLLRTFGLLLVTLLPFLLYLLAFALYSAIAFALYGFLLVSNLPRVPVAVLIGLAVVAFGTGIAILIGLYYLFFPPRRKTLGIEIKKEEQKKLWGVTKEISTEIQAKPIDKIIITPDPGIGVYLEGGLVRTIFGGGRRVLEIGLPSLHDLNADEFKAILAHEYGHFSNRDTQWSSFTYSMGNSLLSTLRSTPGPRQDEKEEGGIVGFIMSLNPAYWILLLFVTLYFKITNGFSRVREVMADIMAMNLYGGKAFSNGLLKLAVNDLVFSEVVQAKYVPQLLREGKTISNLSRFMEFVYDQVDKSDVERLKLDVLAQSESHGIYDSHPALKVRVDYAKRFSSPEESEPVLEPMQVIMSAQALQEVGRVAAQEGEKDKRSVNAFFDDWDSINERAAEIYNLRLLVYIKALSETSSVGQEENNR